MLFVSPNVSVDEIVVVLSANVLTAGFLLSVCVNILLLMFVPKIVFGQQEKVEKRLTHISGLETRITKFHRVFCPKREATQDEPSSLLHLSETTASDDADASAGEKIVTRKSVKELVKMV